ncbi:uncharacterized protein LOC125066438 [Vanessa atalanta]|uniref:uncharacterized protein LOC125066438 n=1 Tax=Vanessa atalanta TaxID=42275 RepID=UPI001FCD2FBD|nr:uncharacterized protein LOC125066438 [Vanessa atalanta]
MGIKLLVLLSLLVGVLYCLHILAQDYQAITAPKLLRLLFKRDINSTNNYTPTVRWKRILKYDPLQCARYLYCDLGARSPDSDLRRGLIYMLALEVKEEDKIALTEFESAYSKGRSIRDNPEHCKKKYPICPFDAPLLLDLVNYIIKTKS